MLSFSGSAKAEVCKEYPQSGCCALAECFGILLFCNSFSEDCIKIITESQDFARLLPKLFRKAFGLSFDSCPEEGSTCLPVVEEDCCKASFLRGAFLTGGSVTSPAKSYHMELASTHQSVVRECDALIRDTLGFSPKTASRAGGKVLYLKQSDLISDFLTYLGAPVAAMGIMEAKLEKELNNKVNRCCNCDDANTSKVVEAAQEQLAAIRVLREKEMVEALPGKLQAALKAREENPEATLTELAAMMEPPITKPAMNHRLKRIVEIAGEVRE